MMQGKYYLFLERTSQLHRELAPLQPWLMYLLNSKGEGAGSIPNKVQSPDLPSLLSIIKLIISRSWESSLQQPTWS